MGTFSVRIEIADITGAHSEVADAIVDTGATRTTIPASILERIGIQPYRSARRCLIRLPRSSAHRLLHECRDPCLVGRAELRQGE
jgi:hypothetical protein